LVIRYSPNLDFHVTEQDGGPSNEPRPLSAGENANDWEPARPEDAGFQLPELQKLTADIKAGKFPNTHAARTLTSSENNEYIRTTRAPFRHRLPRRKAVLRGRGAHPFNFKAPKSEPVFTFDGSITCAGRKCG
jgi:hypothetical protein